MADIAPVVVAQNQWTALPVPEKSTVLICQKRDVRISFAEEPGPLSGFVLKVGKAIRVKAGDAGFIRPAGQGLGGILVFESFGGDGPDGGEVIQPTAPGQFGELQWSVGAGDLPGQSVLSVLSLPQNGGSPVTGLFYRIGSGPAVPLGSGVGSYPLAGLPAGASISIAAANAIGQGTWSAAKTIAPASSIRFGSRNAPGLGSVSVGIPDGTYGAFTVTGGELAVAASGTAAGTYDVAGIPVEVIAGAIVLGSNAEIQALLDLGVSTRSGASILLRGGRTLQTHLLNFASKQAIPAIPYRWAPLDPASPPILTGWAFGAASAQQGGVTFEGLTFYRAQDPLRHSWAAPDYAQDAIINVDGRYSATGDQAGTIDVTLRQCEIYSDMDDAQAGGRMVQDLRAININLWCQGITVEACSIHHVSTGIVVRGRKSRILRNSVTRTHADAIAWQSGAAGTLIEGNDLGLFSGDQDNLHPDGGQYNPNGAYSAHGVLWRGNRVLIGEGFALGRSAARDTGDFPALNLSGTVSLTAAGHAHRNMTWSAGTVATLPSAASARGMAFFFRLQGTPGAITISAQSGEGSGIFPLAFNGPDGVRTNTSNIAFWSDGSQWHLHVRGIRGWSTYHRGDWTLDAVDGNRIIYLDPDGANRTITLNSTAAATGVKLWAATGAVTVVPAAGHTLILNGNSVPSVTLSSLKDVWTLTRSGTVWTAVTGDFTIQGLYGNRDLYNTGLTVAGNLLIGSALNGIKFEDVLSGSPAEIAGLELAYNTVVKAYTGAAPRTGLDGWSTSNPTVNTYVRGASNRAHRNIVAGQVIANDGAAKTENTEIGIVVGDKDSTAKYEAAFGPGRDFNPQTFAAAAAAFAHTTRGATVYWDFDARAPRATAPVAQLVSAPAAIAPADNIVLTWDQALWEDAGGIRLLSGSTPVAASISIMGTTITIDPSASLAAGTYTVDIPAGALQGWFRPIPARTVAITVAAPVLTWDFTISGTDVTITSQPADMPAPIITDITNTTATVEA